MARKTVYNNNLTSDWQGVNEKNKNLLKEFIRYCVANNKSPQTCEQYEAQLKVFFCWNFTENDDKFFVDIKKRELVNFFGWGREMGWSPCRLASLRAVLSSFSNFIERILDEDYPTFRNLVKVLEPIVLDHVREKTVIGEADVIAGIEKLVARGEYQYACFLALLLSSGMRKSEAAQMKVSYFTTAQNIVFGGMAYATPKIRTKGPGMKGKQIPRYIFRATFDKYLNLWLEKRKELGIECDDLFVINRGYDNYQPAKSENFTYWCQKIGEIIGEENLYCHALRHSFVSELKRRGWPDSVLLQIVKWTDGKMIKIYNDNSDEDELASFFAKLNPDGTYTENNPLGGETK